MRSLTDYSANWGGMGGKPELTQRSWNMMAIPAIVLAVMAILQIISYGKFKDWLQEIRVGWPAVVAVVVIIAELWGALSLLPVSLNRMVRFIGVTLAVLVSGFWFIENLQLAANGGAGQLPNSGFFGKYLTQSPGWWTILEVSVLLFWVVYSAELLKWRPGNR
jgi:ABC-type branched-subunit amino acid transport system permease subunit